ncbi:DEAD/DEAH box helicase [Scytonema sp. NUACC26]|uniref:DEAD/DEAH box helicase n=1 Tax=Scytonema sp. NUACC26 TaxID=3140176 RepID=UPI0034DC4BA3
MNMIYLKDILQQGDDAIAAASTFLGLKMAQLDCSDVETISGEQLSLLFSKIPPNWEFEELGKAIVAESMSETLGIEFFEFVNNRGSSQSPVAKTNKISYGTQTPKKAVRDVTPISIYFTSPSVPLSTAPSPLNPIKVLDKVIAEYRDYLLTEFRAKDLQLKAALEKAIDQPLFLAQEPFYQAHRPFKSGEKWQNLPIDAKLARVMQQRSRSEFAYLHQSQAIDHLLGQNASPLVVTTGTGSGKTETFLLPVIQNAIADAAQFRRQAGLTAILVYPINALANDQFPRIQNYLKESAWEGAITVAKYDRGTKLKERQALRQNPPHILLTNYMMLEYLLVRPADREDIFANHRCRFLVLDEVHTYRGTLGSNIALEQLAQTPPTPRPLETGDLDDPLPWLEAYDAGVGSPLELKFLQLFEKHGFHPQKQTQPEVAELLGITLERVRQIAREEA